jgi:hypothetical protein
LFRPEGPKLDFAALRHEVERDDPELCDAFWGGFAGELPFFGIYGKLGETKGSFALLAAMQRLKQEGVRVGLVAMAHGWPALEQKFRARAEELGVADRVLQIPFLPHWRVPEFLRSCLAVCCLEQDFPILFHTPIIAREVLTCGRCLVASTEVIRKLPDHLRLPDGYGCVAISDVWDVEPLAARLAMIVLDPSPLASVAARGRAFAGALQAEAKASGTLEGLLQSARRRRTRRKARPVAPDSIENASFPVAQAMAQAQGFTHRAIDLALTREVLSRTEGAIGRGDESLRPAAAAIRIEIALAEAELAAPDTTESADPLFRLRGRRWGLEDGELAGLFPVRDANLRIITFDSAELAEQQTRGKRVRKPSPRNIVAFAQADAQRRERLLVSNLGVRILHLSDGGLTAQEIGARIGTENPRAGQPELLRLIEELFVAGLLRLQEAPTGCAGQGQPLSTDRSEPASSS